MQRNNLRLWTGIGMGIILMVLFAGGCRRGIRGGSATVEIKQDNYRPELGRTFPAYRGRSIYLANVDNQANNTTTWYYYNPEGSITYESWPSLTSYFWYCMDKAFTHAGLRVYSMDQSTSAPEVDVTLNSMTDRQFRYTVSVRRTRAPFQKQFAVTMAPAATVNAGALEARAYRMIDKMVREILEDRGFERAVVSRRGR